MRASIIVVSYNSIRYLPACLTAIAAQLGADDELIVVDNASTDGSAAYVARVWPMARLLRRANDGYAGGNNAGAALARGDLLVVLNPDALVLPGALDALLAPLADPTIGMTTARILLSTDSARINTSGNDVHFTGLAYCRGAGAQAQAVDDSGEVAAVSGAAFAMRRTVFHELGGFDAAFFLYVEDTDLSWRVRMRGLRIWYTAAARVLHRYTMRMSSQKLRYIERNRLRMLLQNLSARTLVRMLPALLLTEGLTWGFALLRGAPLTKLRVYHELWCARAAIGVSRRRIQHARRVPDRIVLRAMTSRLAFEQVADQRLARVATLLVAPLFWLVRLPVWGGQ